MLKNIYVNKNSYSPTLIQRFIPVMKSDLKSQSPLLFIAIFLTVFFFNIIVVILIYLQYADNYI